MAAAILAPGDAFFLNATGGASVDLLQAREGRYVRRPARLTLKSSGKG